MSFLKIGHRGASGYVPENTMLSFRKALEMGAGGIEFDIQLSKDGIPVIIHDDTLERTTNERGKISDYLLKDLQKFDAGMGEKIPMLEACMREMAEKLTLFIEIKDARAAQSVVDLVHRYAPQFSYNHLNIIGFDFELLADIKQKNFDIFVGVAPPEGPVPHDFLARAQAAHMGSVNPCIDDVNQNIIDDAHRRNLKIITWTCNTPSQIAKAKALKIDGIMSDFPDRL